MLGIQPIAFYFLGCCKNILAGNNPVLECSGTGLKTPFSKIWQPITSHFLFAYSFISRGLTSVNQSNSTCLLVKWLTTTWCEGLLAFVLVSYAFIHRADKSLRYLVIYTGEPGLPDYKPSPVAVCPHGIHWREVSTDPKRRGAGLADTFPKP